MNTSSVHTVRAIVPSAQAMYAAAARWRDEALIGDRSFFSAQPVDGLAAARELVRDFIEQPDDTSRDFLSKIRDQLSTTSAAGVQLAAELLYIHTLIVASDAFKSSNKVKLVSAVLAIRTGETVPPPEELLDALRGGFVNPGQAYNTYRWKMLAYLIRFYEMIKSASPSEREATLSSWTRFQDAVNRLDDQSVWSQRFALEHLLFPDVSPPVISRQDRSKIVDAFGAGKGESSIEEVVRTLAPNVGYGEHQAVDLYWTPYREQWRGTSQGLGQYAAWALKIAQSDASLIGFGRDHNLGRVDRLRAVFAAADEHQDAAHAFQDAVASWNLLDTRVTDDFTSWLKADPEGGRKALRALAERPGPESIDRFAALVPPVAAADRVARLSIASVLLMAIHPEQFPPWRAEVGDLTRRLSDGWSMRESATDGEHYLHYLERLDTIKATVDPDCDFLHDRLDTQWLVWTIATAPAETFTGWSNHERGDFEGWRAGKPGITAQVVEPQPDSQSPLEPKQLESLESLANKLSMESSEWLEETMTLLREKKHLILQGPPGTGKTYIAREVAKFLAGDGGGVVTVQFHPGTSYEDFVQGLRPDPTQPTQFKVVDGPLLRISRLAAKNTGQTHVLLIDEINRGNVPAIFGELYYLLEYRGDSVTMLYGDQHSLPENLFFIGTMNTADRSITALDSALRRRFYIRDLNPTTEPVQGMLRTFLKRKASDLLWLADLLDLANEQLKDPDLAIGPSHFMGEDVSEEKARRAWANSVLPTLREYFHDNQARTEPFDFDALKAQIEGPDDTAPQIR